MHGQAGFTSQFTADTLVKLASHCIFSCTHLCCRKTVWPLSRCLRQWLVFLHNVQLLPCMKYQLALAITFTARACAPHPMGFHFAWIKNWPGRPTYYGRSTGVSILLRSQQAAHSACTHVWIMGPVCIEAVVACAHAYSKATADAKGTDSSDAGCTVVVSQLMCVKCVLARARPPWISDRLVASTLASIQMLASAPDKLCFSRSGNALFSLRSAIGVARPRE